MIRFSRLGRNGRLGNQLWEIASTAGIARTLGEEPRFPSSWDYRPFFNVPDEFFTGGLAGSTEAHETPLVEHMDPRCRDYLQDYNLWKDIRSEVWQWFQPSEQAKNLLAKDAWIYKSLDDPILSIHVRRGDNAQRPNNNHPLRPWSFYEQAMERMKGEFSSIAVFSDEPEWCRGQFAGYEVEYPIAFYVGTPRPPDHEKAYLSSPILDWVDLQLMAGCDRHIIGNSTYAWWGAFLSRDPAPIYPTPWFGTDLQYIDASLMFPESWIPIEHGQQYV